MKETSPKPNQLIVISKKHRFCRCGPGPPCSAPACRARGPRRSVTALFRWSIERHDKHAGGVFHMKVADARVSRDAFEPLGRLGSMAGSRPLAEGLIRRNGRGL